ncbi:hypothetical protein [Klebsiella grimontii]|uniref:hypothetical protein n=1 Tax=Klebsiella grimontii TaxID=2058152 RepID=UPI0018669F62|nr:hypothetical protein [Klebsiella grimontii]
MITVDELSDAFYAASSTFDVAQRGDTDAFSRAIELQGIFDEMMMAFKSENPDTVIFIDVINKSVSITQDE